MTAVREWIQTWKGKKFWPLDPNPEHVDIEDIAHALARVCRYTGHIEGDIYSVAQHSVLVSQICDPKDALWGLTHDATEAYIADIASPVKRSPEFAFYREIEARIQRVICEHFNLPPEMPHSVHKADGILLATEVRDLMGPPPSPWDLPEKAMEKRIVTWSSRVSEVAFLNRFKELTS